MRKCGKRLFGLNLTKSSGSYRSAEIEPLGDDLCHKAIQLRNRNDVCPDAAARDSAASKKAFIERSQTGLKVSSGMEQSTHHGAD
jgi:hypothetical protein